MSFFKNIGGSTEVLYSLHQVPPDGRKIVQPGEVIEVTEKEDIAHMRGLCATRTARKFNSDMNSAAIIEVNGRPIFEEIR